MFCVTCGAAITSGRRFCGRCGTPATLPPPSVPPGPGPPPRGVLAETVRTGPGPAIAVWTADPARPCMRGVVEPCFETRGVRCPWPDDAPDHHALSGRSPGGQHRTGVHLLHRVRGFPDGRDSREVAVGNPCGRWQRATPRYVAVLPEGPAETPVCSTAHGGIPRRWGESPQARPARSSQRVLRRPAGPALGPVKK